MTAPSAHHKQRAFEAIEAASLLIGYECARAHNDPDIADMAALVDDTFDVSMMTKSPTRATRW